jgi:hypothetical protein
VRYCLWGGRRGDVWIGSAQDRALVRRRQREREAMERMARTFRAIHGNVRLLGLSGISAGAAMRKFSEDWARYQRIERRRRRAQWPLWRDFARTGRRQYDDGQ